jgi:hypothetical protein
LAVASQPSIQSLEIAEESILVKSYSATCVCGRVFSHRDRRTLEHNVDEHLVRYHGADAEYRAKLEYVKKEIGQIRKRLNRRYGK